MEYPIASGEKNRLIKAGLQIHLGIEVGLSPGDGALGELQVCTGDHDAKTIFDSLECAKTHPLIEDPGAPGVFITQTVHVKDADAAGKVKVVLEPVSFPYGELQYIFRARALKRGLMRSYDKKNRETTYFKYEFKPSEEMLAELHICFGEKGTCMTGCDQTGDTILKNMREKTIGGLNRILVVLDEDGKKVISCFIDGVQYIDNGVHKIKTSR